MTFAKGQIDTYNWIWPTIQWYNETKLELSGHTDIEYVSRKRVSLVREHYAVLYRMEAEIYYKGDVSLLVAHETFSRFTIISLKGELHLNSSETGGNPSRNWNRASSRSICRTIIHGRHDRYYNKHILIHCKRKELWLDEENTWTDKS